MDTNRYTRTISLNCPTCNCTQFSSSEDGTSEVITCSSCGRVLTRDELLRENSENISAHTDEVKSQVIKDVSKQLHDVLRDAFKGNKNIRIK
jgi:uncharacterized Zn finger protein (UPF0148 family)